MMNKNIFIILVLIILVAVGFYFMGSKDDNSVNIGQPVPGENVVETVVSETPDFVVSFSDSGFSPKELKIKAGDVVSFENKSSVPFWPASAMHPTHAVYPTKGGCIGSTFDACNPISPGQSWAFKFEEKGNWKYHDHLNASSFGSIAVE